MLRKTVIFLFVLLCFAAVFILYDKRLVRNQNSPPQTPSTQLANPASVNCEKMGGSLSLETRGDGGEFGLCKFEDNMACEEWALFRGTCPVGGVKTTGYDNIEQMYCAWIGGHTLAEPDANCTLPDGKICNNTKLYNGSCPVN